MSLHGEVLHGLQTGCGVYAFVMVGSYLAAFYTTAKVFWKCPF